MHIPVVSCAMAAPDCCVNVFGRCRDALAEHNTPRCDLGRVQRIKEFPEVEPHLVSLQTPSNPVPFKPIAGICVIAHTLHDKPAPALSRRARFIYAHCTSLRSQSVEVGHAVDPSITVPVPAFMSPSIWCSERLQELAFASPHFAML